MKNGQINLYEIEKLLAEINKIIEGCEKNGK